MKRTLIVIAILIVTVTSVHAQRKNSTTINIYNKTIIQDNRTKSERAIDRANAKVEKNRSRVNAQIEKDSNRANAQADKVQNRLRKDINKIINSNKIKGNSRPKYKTRKFF